MAAGKPLNAREINSNPDHHKTGNLETPDSTLDIASSSSVEPALARQSVHRYKQGKQFSVRSWQSHPQFSLEKPCLISSLKNFALENSDLEYRS